QQSTLDGGLKREAAVFWVGDSRAYLIGPCGMLPLTRDHSYVQDLIESGSISAEEARTHQMKNVITRCLGGAGNSGAPDVFPFSPGPGEAILLCSDGLTDALDDAQIWQVLMDNSEHSLDNAVKALVRAANEAGGPDNITVVLVEFVAAGW
ncbi:MAG TPA: serine/threonine-protein phosphatase, partial [Firmicutes bacterium]|nr:serine/threonine-protein phosphatase [Bacillota bacterium]